MYILYSSQANVTQLDSVEFIFDRYTRYEFMRMYVSAAVHIWTDTSVCCATFCSLPAIHRLWLIIIVFLS